MCRSRRELSNEYLLANIGVDTAENEPLKVWRKIQFITIVLIRLLSRGPGLPFGNASGSTGSLGADDYNACGTRLYAFAISGKHGSGRGLFSTARLA